MVSEKTEQDYKAWAAAEMVELAGSSDTTRRTTTRLTVVSGLLLTLSSIWMLLTPEHLYIHNPAVLVPVGGNLIAFIVLLHVKARQLKQAEGNTDEHTRT